MLVHALDVLIRDAKAGVAGALNAVLEHFRPGLVLVAAAILRGRGKARRDPEDVVQDVLLQVSSKFKSINGETENEVFGFLREAVKNRIRNAIRDDSAGIRNEEMEAFSLNDSHVNGQSGPGSLSASASTPSKVAIRNEDEAWLHDKLNTLTEDQRVAVDLRYFKDLKLVQISTIMGRSEEAVAGLLKRALQKLREG